MYSFEPENRVYVMINLVLAQLNEAYKMLQEIKPALQGANKEFREKVIASFLVDAKKIGLDSYIKENLEKSQKGSWNISKEFIPAQGFPVKHYSFN